MFFAVPFAPFLYPAIRWQLNLFPKCPGSFSPTMDHCSALDPKLPLFRQVLRAFLHSSKQKTAPFVFPFFLALANRPCYSSLLSLAYSPSLTTEFLFWSALCFPRFPLFFNSCGRVGAPWTCGGIWLSVPLHLVLGLGP